MRLLLLLVGVIALSHGEICPQDVRETGPTLCPRLPKTTHRFKTLRDLAWLLTPRTYFLTNANTFTYAAIYQALTSKCASNSSTLDEMRLHASYAFGDLTISSGSKFMHLVCSPVSKGVHGVWSLLLSKLKRSSHSALNWEAVESSITTLAEKNPHFEDVVGDLGRLRCIPHPLCQSHGPRDSPFCSQGSDPFALGDSRWVLGWTDHISNTTRDGTAITLVGCVDTDAGAGGQPSWATLSTVPQQARDSIHDFWDVAKRHGFDEKWFARQNYVEVHDGSKN